MPECGSTSVYPGSPSEQLIPLGKKGEEIAKAHFLGKGWLFVCQNYRCRAGEIDLIFWDKDELVFLEVKTRYDNRGARKYLFDTVTKRKQQKLRSLVHIFLARYYRRCTPRARIDIVGVLINRENNSHFELKHIIAAV